METNIIPDSIEVDKIEINKLSINKFVILSIVTLGLYELWWIFKSWRFFQNKEKSDIMPAMRTVFSIFYLIPLFNKILNLAKNNGYKHSYVSVFLFVGLFIANLRALLPTPFFLADIISIVFLIPPFKALNFAVDYCEGFTRYYSDRHSYLNLKSQSISMIYISISKQQKGCCQSKE